MKNKILKIQKCCAILLLPMLFSACHAEVEVDEQFVNEFSTEMQPKIKSMCELFVQKAQENGLYFTQTMFGQFKFVGLKDKKYQILKFEKQSYEPLKPANVILDISGDYIKNEDVIHLEKSKQDNEFIAQDLVLVQKQADQYLVNDFESVARQISWNNQFGSEDGFLKKIDCTEQSYKGYSGEEEQAPSFQDLPKQLKTVVLNVPLHAQIHDAQDITQDLLDSDDPETPIEQRIEINTSDARKLFKHQQICIIQGHGKLWSGMIEEPRQPLSSAIIFVYTSDPSEKLGPVRKGDIISTSEKECQQQN